MLRISGVFQSAMVQFEWTSESCCKTWFGEARRAWSGAGQNHMNPQMNPEKLINMRVYSAETDEADSCEASEKQDYGVKKTKIHSYK